MTADGTLYLLHFDPPYRHAGHYLGYVQGGPENVDRRLAEHIAGQGSPLVRAAVAAGSTVTVARTWLDSDRTTERRLKNGKNGRRRLCPTCTPAVARRLEGELCLAHG